MTPAAGTDIVGSLQVGDNSEEGETPEYSLTDSPDEGQRTWDADTSDGFDSGGVSVLLMASAGGGPNAVTWMVGDSISSDTNFNFVTSVEIQAVAKSGCHLIWSSISITFFKNGLPRQIVMIPDECNPMADPFEQVLQIVPDSDDNTGVLVTAVVQLLSPDPGLPAPHDMAGSILVHTN